MDDLERNAGFGDGVSPPIGYRGGRRRPHGLPLDLYNLYLVVRYDLRREVEGRLKTWAWRWSGSDQVPPHALKARLVRKVGRQFGLRTLIESGTFRGDMVFAVRRNFRRIVTIEVDADLALSAQRRFAVFPHISVLHGDSGAMLASTIASVDEPCLFWLDGHYSGPGTGRGASSTPIISEIRQIGNRGNREDAILIDDARCFGSVVSYPTIEIMTSAVREYMPHTSISVVDDVIRVLPRRSTR